MTNVLPRRNLPELEVLPNGGLYWVSPMIPGLPGDTLETTRFRYEELKGWPDSSAFKEWVKENNPDELCLQSMMHSYTMRLHKIAAFNKFDIYPTDHLLAFLMGRHSRLALRLEHDSHVYSLPNGISEIIADQLTPV